MNLKECYAALGGDYDGVISRLRSERMVQKFALKFLADGSYDLLRQSMDQKNYEEAFRAAHTIKGVCQNLSFSRLYESSSQLSEALRSGWTPEADVLLPQVEQDYLLTTDALKELRSEERRVGKECL